MTSEEAIKELRDASDNEVRYGDTEHHYNEVMKRIEALDMAIKALEQQQRDCNTCKHSDNGNCAYTEECHECMWKSKYEKQPCEDCISRQRVLDIIKFEYKWLLDAKVYDICTSIAFSAIMSKISEMPPVTPKAESKDVLAKIKAEIEQKCCITVGSENEPAITLYDVFRIIDKYKAESKEEK